MKKYNADNVFNINLHLVTEAINTLIKTEDFCQCPICLDDICAHSMIKLAPMYTTNLIDKERVLGKQDFEQIINLVKESIVVVTENPHH